MSGLHRHHSRATWLSSVDLLAIGLSGLCAVHCAVLPLLMLTMPFVGAHEFEGTLRWVMAAVGILGIGLGALTHRNTRAIPLLLAALVILAASEVIGHGPMEIVASIAASAFLIRAHWLNMLACRKAENSPAEPAGISEALTKAPNSKMGMQGLSSAAVAAAGPPSSAPSN